MSAFEAFKGGTCLVTGGAGFIGSHLVDALLAHGTNVRVIDDLSTGSLENLSSAREKIDFREESIANMQAVDAAVAGCDYIFHQAALGSVPPFDEAAARHHGSKRAGNDPCLFFGH